ncbi:uncharacterized protein LOC124670270 [Lolium rigidum]|uniref:uncharacterized protein LOC124670270 n=1 Tax=Lolium rigidum TaxID=89674 RepID=UPI001F5D85DE|nr:uncharacterized protein LOC124670270 [Lolium rigidum]
MASGAQVKMIAIAMMLAIVLVVAANAEPDPSHKKDICIDKTDKVPGATACICSKNCACAGKCILAGGDGDEVKTCFVECVLKNDCKCNAEGSSDPAPQANK